MIPSGNESTYPSTDTSGKNHTDLARRGFL